MDGTSIVPQSHPQVFDDLCPLGYLLLCPEAKAIPLEGGKVFLGYRSPSPSAEDEAAEVFTFPCPLSCRKSAPNVGSRPPLARSGPCGYVRSAVSRER